MPDPVEQPGGIGTGPAALDYLDSVGIRLTEYRWLWRAGLQGGVFPHHQEQAGRHGNDRDDFDGSWPGADVNRQYCMCELLPIFRDQRGRFAPPPR